MVSVVGVQPRRELPCDAGRTGKTFPSRAVGKKCPSNDSQRRLPLRDEVNTREIRAGFDGFHRQVRVILARFLLMQW
jgi:hypothetical protein